MQLTYNKFKQVVDLSSERLFNKITEAIATSDNAALVAMFDDKLVLLDEDKEQFYLCDYTFDKGVLAFLNFEEVRLTENDDSYLDEVANKYFDIDDKDPITVGDMMTGFKLKYKNDSKRIYQEARDRKYRKIQESPRVRAIKRARDARNMFSEEIKHLLEEPFVQHLDAKLYAPNVNSQESPAGALNKVAFKNPYPIFVNTDIGGEAKALLTLKDNTNVMDAMTGVALKVSEQWKSDAFRNKFEKMINQILQTESVELGRASILSFLDENKELFLLKKELFDELITKTTLMMGEGDSDAVLSVFKKIMEGKDARMMRANFFRANKIDEQKLDDINSEIESGDTEVKTDKEPAKDAGNDLDSEEVNKIIDVFKKIKKSLEDDSPEEEYIKGLIDALDAAKVSGIEDSKMKEVIDFLSSVEESPKKKKADKKDEPEEEEEIEL